MNLIQRWIRPLAILLAAITLGTAALTETQLSTTQTPIQIAGDDPKVPTGG